MSSIIRWRRGLVVAIWGSCLERGWDVTIHILSDRRLPGLRHQKKEASAQQPRRCSRVAGSFNSHSHFPAPDLKITEYELRVGGAVRQPFALSYRSLREMPSETRIATLECAGNGRVFLVPAVQGAQWELGAVGTAEWTGVPLKALLERAGVDADACEIVLEGADRGIPTELPVPPGPISYARSLPLSKALQGDVLIAYQMNGADLTGEHGYPARAIVPGHFGMASVKWLTRIEAVREPFQGYFQTSDYAYWDYFDGMPVRRALGQMPLKSEILPACTNPCCKPGLPGFRRSLDGSVRGH